MDTAGTFEMARALSRHKMITALHKHYLVEEFEVFCAVPIR
jgi:GMP reductase